MEVVIVLLVAAIVLSPLVLSIMAYVRTGNAQREIDQLRLRVAELENRRAIAPSADVALTPATAAVPNAVPAPPAPTLRDATPVPAPSLIPPPLPSLSAVPPAASKPAGPGLEETLGGKVASLIGIAAVVLAVVFFVGYAIQHGWIGPALRVALGLFAGAILVAGGHFVARKDERFTMLARVLTGGGAALFYFSTFAAYGIYHLIGSYAAGATLALSSAAVFALASLYNSQLVAIIGLLGAMLTPPLIHGQLDRGIFPMAYIAAVNVPVLLLGRRRDWHVLCNLAFVGTALLATEWLWHELPAHKELALAAVSVLYLEFAALSRGRSGDTRSEVLLGIDLLRQIGAGLLLLGALYWITADHAWTDGRGLIFLVAAVANVGLAQWTRPTAGGLRVEALGFLVMALTFASLALPAQLDGPWVSIGWAVEGVLLAWFARRENSRFLQGGAVLLGLVGLGKSLFFDATLAAPGVEPFFNVRFAVGMVSAIAIGLQGWMARRDVSVTDSPKTPDFEDLLFAAALVFAALVPLIECLTVADDRSGWTWFVATLMVGAMAVAGSVGFARGRIAWATAVVLSALAPLLIFVTALVAWDAHDGPAHIGDRLFWSQLALMVGMTFWFLRVQPSEKIGAAASASLTLVSIGSGIALVSVELNRLHTDSSITIFWSAAALTLVIVGLWRRVPYLRYAGLALFALAVGKVFLVDLADLKGLERVAAFLVAGVLLLVLSFAYQKVAPVLARQRLEKENGP